MNKVATISLSAVGLSALFAVAFVGFAKVNGAPLHTLPVIGSLFPEQAHADADVHAAAADAHAAEPAPAPAPAGQAPETVAAPEHPEEPARAKTGAEAIAERSNGARAGIFEVLDADALYGQEELRALADALRVKNRTADQRNADLDRREDLLQDRLAALEERRRTLDDFAKQLDAREREVAARETEAGRDETTAEGTLGGLPAGELANFFADGELEVLAQRLAGFTPTDTAEILARLSPARAKELLDALPAARWRECAEAYALAVQKAAEAAAAPATRP